MLTGVTHRIGYRSLILKVTACGYFFFDLYYFQIQKISNLNRIIMKRHFFIFTLYSSTYSALIRGYTKFESKFQTMLAPLKDQNKK